MKIRNSRVHTGSALAVLALALSGSAAIAADNSAAPTDAVAADSAGESDAIVVTGAKPTSQASSGTKSDTPLIETPQSISVIDGSEIADLGLQNLNQTLRLVAGVTPETRGSSAEVYDQFKLRGFDAPIYLDGLKEFQSASGYAAQQVDVSRLDRIEIVKGPASALYGQSGPGGLVVESSKLPIARDFYGAVSGTYGNYDLYRADADVGGRIGQTTLWRVYGSASGAHSEQTYGKRRRQTVSAAVTLGSGTPTSFTVLAAYSHDPRNGDYGVFPTFGTLLANPAGKISTKFYGGEPNDYFSREQFGLTYVFRHDFGGGWAFRSSGRYQYVHSALGIAYTGSPITNDVFSRYSYSTREQINSWTFDNQLTGKVETGPLQHSLLFGVDRQVAHSAELYAFGGGTTINVFDPVYGTMATPGSPYAVLNYSGIGFGTPTFIDTRQRQQGVYAQDQISVGGLRVTLSGRQDWARQAATTLGVTQEKADKNFTWRAGALYLTPFGLAPYVSYSTSFEPQSSQLSDGSIARPTFGKQIEAGAKYQVPGTDILITGAWFRIEQSNVVVSNPISSFVTQAGKVRSRGVEIEASGSLPHGFRGKLAFSRQHVVDIKDTDPAKIGLGLDTVGRGGISANLEWAPKSGPAEGLVIGGTVRHVDHTYADSYTYSDGTTTGPLNTPAYTLFDALMRYDLGKVSPRLTGLSLGVNATNLFDKKYLTSCFANYGWCWYGNRRTVQGTIGYHW